MSCGCKKGGGSCTYIRDPFRAIVGIKATVREVGAKILEPVNIYDALGPMDSGILTAFRCYIDRTDVVTSQVTLHATEKLDGGALGPPNNSFTGAAAAEFLLSSSPPSPLLPTPTPHDGQTIATFKVLGSDAVRFVRGLYLWAEVTPEPTAAIGEQMYIRAVVEGDLYHRCSTCGAFPRGDSC